MCHQLLDLHSYTGSFTKINMKEFRESFYSFVTKITDFIEELGSPLSKAEKRKRLVHRLEAKELRILQNQKSGNSIIQTDPALLRIIRKRFEITVYSVGAVILVILGLLIFREFDRAKEKRRILSSIQMALSSGRHELAINIINGLGTDRDRLNLSQDPQFKKCLHEIEKRENQLLEEKKLEFISFIRTNTGEKRQWALEKMMELDPMNAELADDFDEIRRQREQAKIEEDLAEKKRIAASNRERRIDSGFSVWDGSHSGLVRRIKASMNDPDSFKHIETIRWDMGGHLIVLTKFRGRNAFGGIVSNWVKAKIDLDGEQIEILEQGN